MAQIPLLKAVVVEVAEAGDVGAGLLKLVEGLELAAVVERHSDEAAARYPGITTYHTLDQMLADESLELIVVATPNETHFRLAKQLLAAGIVAPIPAPRQMA